MPKPSPAVESLEPRKLLTGTITGIVYEDRQPNSQRDPGDPAIPGWTMYIDANKNEQPDPGEPVSVTDATGRYTFANLAAGTYVVRENPRTGYKPVGPLKVKQEVSIAGDETKDNVDFGNLNQVELQLPGLNSEEDAGNNGGTPATALTSAAAVSSKYIVQANNNSITFIVRETGIRLATRSLAEFFAGQPDAATATNPQVLFDTGRSKFIVVATAAGGSRLLVAIARNTNPAKGGWRFNTIDVPASAGAGVTVVSPTIAVDNTALFIASDVQSGGAAVGSRLWIYSKKQIAAAKPVAAAVYDPSAQVGLATQLTGVAIARYSARNLSNARAAYLVSATPAANAGDALTIVRINRPLKTPIFSLRTIANPGDVPAASNANTPASQPGAGPAIDTAASPTAAAWRENFLWVAHTYTPATGPDAGQATVGWFHVNVGSNPGVFNLVNHGFVGGEDIAAGTSTFAPSIAVDRDQFMALTFNAAGASTFAGAYVVGRRTDDPAGYTRAPLAIVPGAGVFSRTTTSGTVSLGTNSIVLDNKDPNRFFAFAHAPADPGATTGRFSQELISFRLPEREFPVVV